MSLTWLLLPLLLAHTRADTAALDALLVKHEGYVQSIAEALGAAARPPCDSTASAACVLSARLSSFDVTCMTGYGTCAGGSGTRRHVATDDRGSAQTAGLATRDTRSDVRWIDSVSWAFARSAATDQPDDTLWRYFGTRTGTFVQFPGTPMSPAQARFDPRVRPWYVAAATGPKDMVLVFDTSLSMLHQGRWDLAREALHTLLDTLTPGDFVGLVGFGQTGHQLCDAEVPCGHLSSATRATVTRLHGLVDNVVLTYNTHMEAGLRIGLDLLSVGGEHTSGCPQSALLFLTDGEPFGPGLQGQELVDYVITRNRAETNATIFSYSLGASADDVIPSAIGCQSGGTWAKIADGGNLVTQMSQFYEYYARVTDTSSIRATWVVPYQDSNGGGLVTTVSLPVYDQATEPPAFLGVVGVDVQVSALEAVSTGYSVVLQRMQWRTSHCRRGEDSWQAFCVKQQLRRGNCFEPTEPACTPVSEDTCTTRLTTAETAATFCGTDGPAVEPCCGDRADRSNESSGGLSHGAVAGITVAVGVVFMVVMFTNCHRQSHRQGEYLAGAPVPQDGKEVPPGTTAAGMPVMDTAPPAYAPPWRGHPPASAPPVPHTFQTLAVQETTYTEHTV